MNILFVSIAWPSKGLENLYSDLMNEFKNSGHNIYVLGSQDSNGSNDQNIFTVENEISVVRVRSGKIRKASYLKKAVNLLTLGRKMLVASKKHYGSVDFDLIICSTPPITLYAMLKKLKKKYNVPLYLIVKDIWPQGSVDLKVIKKYSVIWSYLRFNEIRTYKIADYIGAMSLKNVQYLLKHNNFLSADKVEVCPNAIEPSSYNYHEETNQVRVKYQIPKNACVFIFSGNLAKGHGLEFLVDCIKKLKDYPNAFFLIGGSGTHLKYIQRSFDQENLKNVLVYEWLPREDFELLLATSNVGLILLDKRFTIPQFPSRLLSYLDASKPVLCAVNDNTDIGEIVEESNCGINILHGDVEGFIRNVKYLSENLVERNKMGISAKKLLLTNYKPIDCYKIIMNHFDN